MRKTLLAIAIILALIFISSGAWAAPGDEANNPIFISTAAELDAVRDGLDKYYKLSNDIDLTSYLASGGAGYAKWATAGWLPIGPISDPFTGGFDGNGHKITGLWIDRNTSNVGLFGAAYNTTIVNLGVEIAAAGVTGSDRTGGLLGYQLNGSIEGCYVTGNVSGNSTEVGGLLGYQSGGDIKNCYTTGNVSSSASSVGGLVGYIASGSISNCYVTGDVSSLASFVGGLVGYQNSGNIEGCYATGNVISNSIDVGGLVGHITSGSISNCYATGNVSSSTSDAGGLVGYQVTGNITNCYATGNASAVNSNAGGFIGYQASGNIANCFATGRVSSPTAAFGIAGELLGAIADSYRYIDLMVNGAAVLSTDAESAPDRRHGGVKTSEQLMAKDTYTDNSWLFNDSTPTAGPWHWDSSGFPKLNIGTENFPFDWNPGDPFQGIRITSHPANVTVTAGSITGYLSVSASVSPDLPLSYQWYTNASPINTGGEVIAGATSAQFIIPTDLTVGPHYYYCVVSATGVEPVSSNAATVTVSSVSTTPVITIETHPTDAAVTLGSISGSLFVTAIVSDGSALWYQWYYSQNGSYSDGLAIGGANTASLRLGINVTPSELRTYYYFCAISAVGADTVTTDIAAVTVVEEPTPTIIINTHPVGATVTAGSITGRLSVSASVSPDLPLSYQWYTNTGSNTGSALIAGATSADFPIPTSLTEGNYFYYCMVSAPNVTSVVSDAALVTVSQPSAVITINTQPVNTSVVVGNISGSLSVIASVTPSGTLSYQWYYNTSNSNTGGELIAGATSANFPIPTTLIEGPYHYYCLVSAVGAESVTSSVATVTVTSGPIITPVITINVHPLSVRVVEGNISHSLSVSASVTGGGTLDYQWYSNTTNSNTGGAPIAGATGYSFPIPPTLTIDTYYYYCVVSASGAESVTSSVATVTVAEESEVPVEGVTVSPELAVLAVGSTRMLIANVMPSDATIKDVSWRSDNTSVATVSDNGLVRAVNEGTAIITVTTSEGGFEANCLITVQRSGVVTVSPTYPSDRREVSDKTGIPENELTMSRNMVFLSQRLAIQIAKDLVKADVIYVNLLPIFSAQINAIGQTATIALPVKGRELQAMFPFEVNLIGMTSWNTGKLFNYVGSPSEFTDKCFTILHNNSMNFGEIDPDEDYDIVVFIRDGGEFDLDRQVNGEIIASVYIASGRMSGGGGGGGGCATMGFGCLALAFAIPFIIRKRR